MKILSIFLEQVQDKLEDVFYLCLNTVYVRTQCNPKYLRWIILQFQLLQLRGCRELRVQNTTVRAKWVYQLAPWTS